MLTKVLKLLILLGSSLAVECYVLNQLTVEEKVGQLFITYFEGETVNKDAVKLLKEAKLGGIIYYKKSNAIDSPDKVKQLSHDLQNLAKKECKIPLFIAVDQEGGIVSRLNNGFTLFP